jgi:predicted RNA binding protein YcfA (HicA-like mRNA interferase family)
MDPHFSINAEAVDLALSSMGGADWQDSSLRCISSMKVSEVLELLKQDGWYLAVTRGSHRQYKHPTKPGRVTVPGKPSHDLAPGTLNSILEQAGLKN